MIVRCAGCGAEHLGWSCPGRDAGDDVEHVLVPPADLGAPVAEGENPFVRYRRRLASYRLWLEAGRDDAAFVDLVGKLGPGFRRTSLASFPALDEVVEARVWVKDETAGVAGSHKARHLFGVLLALATLDGDADRDLAVASCGNAARAAAVLASDVGRHLTTFVPPSADPALLAELRRAGASVELCERDGRAGDPCYRRFRAAVAAGAVPFSCQGPDNSFSIEGASTIAWEVDEQLPGGVDRVVVQVGGGALASALARAWPTGRPIFDIVQTAGALPMVRAICRLRDDGVTIEAAARRRSRYMWSWESQPASIADGILDDETYDWLAVAGAVLSTGGAALGADEATLREAHALARRTTGIAVSPTGAAGLAGLLLLARAGAVAPDSDNLVLFTG